MGIKKPMIMALLKRGHKMEYLINKLLDINFLCVNIDKEAQELFKYLNLEELIAKQESRSKRIFISFNTKKAIDNFNKNKTVENHHLAIHFILIDNLISYIIRQDCKWESIELILNETLKCSIVENRISEDVFNYFQSLELKAA